jgi:hypothetical protein
MAKRRRLICGRAVAHWNGLASAELNATAIEDLLAFTHHGLFARVVGVKEGADDP